MNKFVVKYKICNFGDDYKQAGPYDSYDEARYQHDDIARYEGVYDARIEEVKDEV